MIQTIYFIYLLNAQKYKALNSIYCPKIALQTKWKNCKLQNDNGVSYKNCKLNLYPMCRLQEKM